MILQIMKMRVFTGVMSTVDLQRFRAAIDFTRMLMVCMVMVFAGTVAVAEFLVMLRAGVNGMGVPVFEGHMGWHHEHIG